jgi:hypothetical protein
VVLETQDDVWVKLGTVPARNREQAHRAAVALWPEELTPRPGIPVSVHYVPERAWRPVVGEAKPREPNVTWAGV